MSVRGSKNKIILYIAGACSIVFIILLYQNASQRLEAMEKSYERCHLNEESLSAQLQVNLEYKVRLEKSLQQEKSDHAQVKEDLQNKLEEERQNRERENLEADNKFSALQQQYKILQSEHDDLKSECDKLRQSHLAEINEKNKLESLVKRLEGELKLVKENKNSNIEQLQAKYEHLEKENALLRKGRNDLAGDVKNGESLASHVKLPEKLPLNASILKGDEPEETAGKVEVASPLKSSTSAKRAEQELFPSGNNMYVNTSTPMINPDAVSSQDKILSAGVIHQPQRGDSHFQGEEIKENVGAKPEEMNLDNNNGEAPLPQGVLRAPDVMRDFNHVPAIQMYKEKLKQEGEKNNNAKEIIDEPESVMQNEENNGEAKPAWRIAKEPREVFIRPRANKEIPKNPVYQYQGDYDNRKEEGEDDDDVDPLEYHNDKNQQQQQQQQQPLLQPIQLQQHMPEHAPFQIQEQQQQQFQHQQNEILGGIHFQSPFQQKRESVMIQPK